MPHYVYVLRCADRSLYVGSAQNVSSRVNAHNERRGAAYTFKHGPVRLIYSETLASKAEAMKRERQLKRWSREKKEELIAGNLRELQHLSKRRS